jgi:hypothetical protein
MFRADTARANVAYWVIKVGKAVKKEEMEAMVLGMVRQKLKKFKTGKVVIYGNSVLKVTELAQKLGCHAYYYKAMGKASMLEDFMAGKQRVIVATSALGLTYPTSGALSTWIGRFPRWITHKRVAGQGVMGCGARRLWLHRKAINRWRRISR